MLPNGIEDLSKWNVEDSEENREILKGIIPEKEIEATIVELQEDNDQISHL